MMLLRRIAIGIGVFAAAIAMKKCVTQCLRMLREGRDRNELVAQGHGRAPHGHAAAASEALAA